MFLEAKLTWAREESKNAQRYTKAQVYLENDNLENALYLFNQITPDSLYRREALARIPEIKSNLRQKYLLEADQLIKARKSDKALDYLDKTQNLSDVVDQDIVSKKDFCKRNIEDGKMLAKAEQILAGGKLDEALEAIKAIDTESLYYKQACALESKIENMRAEKPSQLPPSQPVPVPLETTKPLLPPEPPPETKPTPNPESVPETTAKSKPPEFDAEKVAKQIERLKQAIKERDKETRLWAIRSLAKYPPSTSGPILLEQLRNETYLDIRCVIVYSLSETEYKEAIPDLVSILKTKLNDYKITPPEVYQEELKKLRGEIPARGTQDISPEDLPAFKRLQKPMAEIRQQMLESYNQKLNLGLLHIRTMQALGKFKSKEATDELYHLIFTPSIPIAYLAIDTLKLINDPKAIKLLSTGQLGDWEKQYRERINFALTELNTPYSQSRSRKGTEWILKSMFMLAQAEVDKPGQSVTTLMKALTITMLLSNPAGNLYNFSSEDNLMMEFINLANLLKGNNPEIMLYDYDLLIKYIKDEMLTRALYQTFQDVLKPPLSILVPTPGPEAGSKGKPTPPDTK
jgi:hypothetical protein